ncbi:MAG: hypothetical protein ACO3DQ_01105 [Cephaloticoccus sp.]
MTRPLVVLGSVLALLLGAGCHGPANEARTLRETPGIWDRTQARANYVDGNYEKYLKGGRAQDESAARALAGLEWDQHARRNQDRAAETVTWRSDSKARTEQRGFEERLREMGY